MEDTSTPKFYRDQFKANKDKEITILSANINRLRTEEWRAKNNQVRDLLLSIKANIIVLQEVNIN